MHAQFRQFRQQAEFNAKVTLESAYHGFDVAVALPDGGSVTVRVKPGTPNGYKTVHDVNESLVVIVVTRIVDARFKVKDPTDCGFAARQIDGRPITCLETGDIETTIEADALDLILGGWVKVPDFLGDTYDVRIPSGFNPMHRLRVKGKGYYNWLHELQRPESTRSDLFVKVIPLFAAPANLDRAKIEALEALTRPKAPDATPPTS
jgi:DnaJ-class molecular chaperone